MAQQIGVPTIEKLEGARNFTSWSFSMKNVLVVSDMWDFIESPALMMQQLGDMQFKRLDAKTKAKICLSVATSVYPVIMSCTTAKETWEKLQAAYADSGLLRRLHLLRKLFNTRLENCTSMDEYVNGIRSTQQQLAEIKAPVNDEFVGVIMLTSLTEKYNPMVMALEGSGTKISSDSVATLLLKEDQRPSTSTKDSALYTSKPTPASKTTPVPPRPKHVCTFCKRHGHVVSECRNRKKKNKANFSTHVTLYSSFHSSKNPSHWFIDSGATSHMCNNIQSFSNFSPQSDTVTVANNQQILSEGTGTICVNSGNIEKISNALLVPQLSANLLSVSSMAGKGYATVFTSKGAQIYLEKGLKISGTVVATGQNYKGMYKLDISEPQQQAQLTNVRNETAVLWHRRLGHLNVKAMSTLKKRTNGINCQIDSSGLDETCIPCLQGKLAKSPFKKSKSKSFKKCELIHSDLCGPMSTHSWGGALYLLTFTDDFTRKTFGYLLKSKSEVFSKFVEFKQLVENQTNEKNKKFRSDNGREFVNGPMSTFLRENGIIHQTSVAYNPQQNGVAERVNRTIVEKARAMLHDAKLPKAYWGEAVNTAIHLKNLSPTQALKNKIPDELWYGKRLDVSHLRVFGCEAHSFIPKEKRSKLDSKTQSCIFVGYSTETKGYRLIDPRNPRAIILSRDVVFIEDKLGVTEPQQPTTPNNSLTYDLIVNTRVDQQETQPPTTQQPSLPSPLISDVPVPRPNSEIPPQNTEPQPQPLPQIDTSATAEPASPEYLSATSEPDEPVLPEVPTEPERRYPVRVRNPLERFGYLTSDLEPESFKEVTDHEEKEKWLEAMHAEYDSLIKNGTWVLVDRPSGRKTIKCKWVFKLKKDTSGQITKYKARLVAKGFTQVAGIDYSETFAPVARLSSVRLLLAFAAQRGLQVDHLDVETAFLNGDLDEEIYMEQPDGFSTDPKAKYAYSKRLYMALNKLHDNGT
ncbi:hypothetical protein O0L34_g9278 [Tuta absoluta]|nr:hypothetical protein O0L34_g9278 [Tuta absoluta]